MASYKGQAFCDYCMAALKTADAVCDVCHRQRVENTPLHHLKPSTVLGGKYLIGCALGEGGFGITYIGRDLNLNMRVAIKEYYPNGYALRSVGSRVQALTTSRPVFDLQKGVQKTLEEAQRMAKFFGITGIVNVLNFFEENGTAYIVMEYLDGMTLEDYCRRFGRLPVNTLLSLLDPVLLALQKVHEAELIHRDVSPDNIMLQKNGQLKLLDFGAARETVSDKTITSIYKEGYAPYEQISKKIPQGAWTDVYALCATIYRCITGVKPDKPTDRIFNDDIKRPSAFGVEITEQQERALLHGLEVEAHNRTQTIRDLRRELGLERGIKGGSISWPELLREEKQKSGAWTEYYSNNTKTVYRSDVERTVYDATGARINYNDASLDSAVTIYDPSGGKTVCDISGSLTQYVSPEAQRPVRKIALPERAATVTYDGKAHSYVVISTEDYIVQNVSATDVGTYGVTIELKDKENTVWENDTADNLRCRLTIVPKTIPVPMQLAPVIYDGKPHSYALPSTEDYTVEEVIGACVGSYCVNITLRDRKNTTWSNGKTDHLIHELVIRPKPVDAPKPADAIVYDGEAHTYPVPSTEDYAVEQITATDAGVYNVKVALRDRKNTAWSNGTTDHLIHKLVIQPKPVAAPKPADAIVYDGEAHTYPVPSTKDYTVEQVTAADPGAYDVNIALRDKKNTTWTDGSIHDLTQRFIIKRRLKKRKIFLLAGIAAVVAVIVLTGIFWDRQNAVHRMESTLPTERKMASDCVGVLADGQVFGGILDVEVDENTFNKKDKTYFVECTVTVLGADGNQTAHKIVLGYVYRNGEWVFDEMESKTK